MCEIWEIIVWGKFSQKEPEPAVQGWGIHILSMNSASGPLLTQLQLQRLDERVLALVTEGASEVIHVQGPDHGPTQPLLFEVADLYEEKERVEEPRGAQPGQPWSPAFSSRRGPFFSSTLGPCMA